MTLKKPEDVLRVYSGIRMLCNDGSKWTAIGRYTYIDINHLAGLINMKPSVRQIPESTQKDLIYSFWSMWMATLSRKAAKLSVDTEQGVYLTHQGLLRFVKYLHENMTKKGKFPDYTLSPTLASV